MRYFHSSFPALALKPFILTDIGEGIAEVELMQWFVKPGDEVKEFDPICEVQSDKATVEITSRYSGIVKTIHHNIGEMAVVGKALVDIEVPDVGGENDEMASKSETSVKDDTTQIQKQVEESHSKKGTKQILTTPAVRRIAREHNIDLSLVVPTGPQGRILKSDALDYLKKTKSGAIEKEDARLDSTPVPQQQQKEEVSKKDIPYVPTPGETVPIRGIRRLMVKSMNESLKIPHFGYNDEVNVTELINLRKHLKKEAERRGFKLSFLPILTKAASLALSQFPILNSSLSSDHTHITYHIDHNIGLAMDTPRGLIVPCIKQCQKKSIFEIAEELTHLQQLGINNKLNEEHLQGTTFSLSNIGNIGGTYMSPVITSPQVGIGAIGKIQKLPRFDKNGNVIAADIMQISWSGDHRVIDGATMAHFSNKWKQYLEKPLLLIGDLQ